MCFHLRRSFIAGIGLFFSILGFQALHAQCDNLVPNGGFELNNGLPNDDCSWGLAVGWTNAATSSECNSSNGTPDYFHLEGQGELSSLPLNYFSELLPLEGSAVMGIGGNLSFLDNAREYISITLNSPLVIGESYSLSFSMTIGTPQVGGLYTDGWGVLLSEGIVLQPTGTNGLIAPTGSLFSVPGVFTSQEWQTFTFDFVADQAYTQLTFGNFLSDAEQTIQEYGTQEFISLAYVFIDDFVLEGGSLNAPELDLGADFDLCTATSTINAAVDGALSYSWNNGANTSEILVAALGLYAVSVEWTCGVVVDSVVVNPCPVLTVDLGLDLTLCEGESATITSTVSGGLAPYTYQWSVPLQTNAQAVQVSAIQNTLISLQVTDASGSTAIDDVAITVNANLLDIDLGPDTILCPGESISLDATTALATGYAWNTGNNASTQLISEPGEYSVAISSLCNVVSDAIVVTSGAIDLPVFANTAAICPGDEVNIGPTLLATSDVVWSDDPSASFPRSIDETGLYTITVTDSCGTRNFDITVAPKNCGCEVFIPNCFTPDNDGLNDVFFAEISCDLAAYDLRIFNAWGQEIFQSNDPTQKWTGGATEAAEYFAQDGVYNYILKIETTEANGLANVEYIKGSVLMIR